MQFFAKVVRFKTQFSYSTPIAFRVVFICVNSVFLLQNYNNKMSEGEILVKEGTSGSRKRTKIQHRRQREKEIR